MVKPFLSLEGSGYGNIMTPTKTIRASSNFIVVWISPLHWKVKHWYRSMYLGIHCILDYLRNIDIAVSVGALDYLENIDIATSVQIAISMLMGIHLVHLKSLLKLLYENIHGLGWWWSVIQSQRCIASMVKWNVHSYPSQIALWIWCPVQIIHSQIALIYCFLIEWIFRVFTAASPVTTLVNSSRWKRGLFAVQGYLETSCPEKILI